MSGNPTLAIELNKAAGERYWRLAMSHTAQPKTVAEALYEYTATRKKLSKIEAAANRIKKEEAKTTK